MLLRAFSLVCVLILNAQSLLFRSLIAFGGTFARYSSKERETRVGGGDADVQFTRFFLEKKLTEVPLESAVQAGDWLTLMVDAIWLGGKMLCPLPLFSTVDGSYAGVET
jgi:hypothetical protein